VPSIQTGIFLALAIEIIFLRSVVRPVTLDM